METCELCDGPLMLLGQLGNRVHVQCRNCGMQFSHVEEADETEEFETVAGS